MSDSRIRVYGFGEFRLDAEKHLLFFRDQIVALTPKALDTLLALIESRGEVLSKEELMRRVWPDQFVEENNLAQNIYAIRKSLGDLTGGAKYVETIPKRGYRFIGEVTTSGAPHDEHSTEAGAHVMSRAVGDTMRTHSQAAPTIAQSRSHGDNSSAPFLVPKTQYAVSTGDVNIAYQVIGDGPFDLVFVMGWISHLEYFWREPSFARFLMRLASFSRLILLDKRGTGLSDRVQPSELPTLEQRMTDVQAVMDAAGSDRAALLGVSEGGPMCSLFAATHPARTVALVMIGTYAKRTRSEDYPWAPTEEEAAAFHEEMRRNWGEAVGIEERAPSVARDPAFRKWWAEYLRMGASPSAALALTRMNAEIDVREVLPSVRIPSLIIHRAEDACLPAGGGRYVASRIPGARYVELPGRDHLPFVGDQDAILDEIEEFLTGVRPAPEIDRVLTTVMFALFSPDDQSIASASRPELSELNQSYVRRELALFRGKEIELSDDHLFATFDGPARAIRCAKAIVTAISRLGINVRAGLHTGECDVIGEKVAGATVNLGMAVAALASPREMLITHTVKDLVAGSGIHFKSRGTRSFGTMPGEWRLFSVEPTKESQHSSQ
jgi:DNA-binding winged helix-turn-helix (wHTH) protein/pimeloyl-ACP methyl ester carboxylesterase